MGELHPGRKFILKWAGCVSAIWMMHFSGCYTFATYSSALKEALAINQVRLNLLSVGKDLGDALGVVAGVLSAYIPSWALLTLGVAVSVLGYGTQWLIVSENISPLPFWMVFVVCVMAGNAVTWINIATFTVSMRNFPRNRGPISGLFKCNMGLTAAIYAMFCDYLFAGSASSFLLMLTICPVVPMLLSAFLFQTACPASSRSEEEEEEKMISVFNALSLILALYLLMGSLISPSDATGREIFAGILALLQISPAFVVLKTVLIKNRKSDSVMLNAEKPQIYSVDGGYAAAADNNSKNASIGNGTPVTESSESLDVPLLLDAGSGDGLSFANENGREYRRRMRCCPLGSLPELGDDLSTLQLLRSPHFYLHYFTNLCAMGSGLAFSNNMGQIGESLGFSSVTVFASLFSLGSFCGRILAGITSEYFVRKAAVPRPVWTAIAKLPMLATYFWLAVGSAASMYIGSIVVGFSHGLHVAMFITVVCEFYGLKNYGTNLAISSTVMLMGSLLFSEVLAGNLYDWEASKQQGLQTLGRRELSTDTVTCTGPECYRLTFIVMAGLLIVAAMVDMGLAFLSRSLYRKIQRLATSRPADGERTDEEDSARRR